MAQFGVGPEIGKGIGGKNKPKEYENPEFDQTLPMDDQRQKTEQKKTEPHWERRTCLAEQEQYALNDDRQHRHSKKKQPFGKNTAFDDRGSYPFQLLNDY